MKSSIKNDTIFLTALQLTTQGLSLLLNLFVNRMLGTENLGLMSLIYAFFAFAIIISNGNIFIATSRFVAEECGKKDGNPSRIFRYSILFSLILSITSAILVYIFAEPVSVNIIKNADCTSSIKTLAFSLPPAALCSCIKGYFHAYRKVIIPAVSELAEFIIKSAVMAVSAGYLIRNGSITLYTAISTSIILGEACSLVFLIYFAVRHRHDKCTNKTRSFLQYIRCLFPVMLNSYIPCILSTANDALVPFTLKQSGCSTSQALSYYGIFEAVVLPVLFFPSMLLSCLSIILIPEISKQRSEGNTIKNVSLISNVISKTIIYSVFVTAVLMIFGKQIGMIASGEPASGRMISILAPVVPFIYLEIVLEGIIKGLGKHSFSSVNYLAEYIIRISALLISVPFIGFYGIAVSYYLSNIVCNTARMILISKIYKTRFGLFGFTKSTA